MDNRFIRQSGLINEDILDVPITVVGAGGIGSFVVLTLAKMGFSDILVIDPDTIEEHNLPNQFYRIADIGKRKVDALREIVNDYTGTDISVSGYMWRKEDEIDNGGVVISAVDSMKSRKDIYDSVKRNRDVVALIDGRMGGNQLEVYTCCIRNSDDKNRYKDTLWSDQQATNVPCTERAVLYNVLNIASWIANQTRLVLSNKQYERQLIMDLENMILVVPQEEKVV